MVKKAGTEEGDKTAYYPMTQPVENNLTACFFFEITYKKSYYKLIYFFLSKNKIHFNLNLKIMESESIKSLSLSDFGGGSDLSQSTNDIILGFEPSDLLEKERYEQYQNAIKRKLEKSKLSYLKVAPQDRVDMASLCLETPQIVEEGICDSPRKNQEIKSRLKSIRQKYAESLQLIEEMPGEFSQAVKMVQESAGDSSDESFTNNGDLRLCLNNSFCKIDFQKLKPGIKKIRIGGEIEDKENQGWQNLNYTPIKEEEKTPGTLENEEKSPVSSYNDTQEENLITAFNIEEKDREYNVLQEIKKDREGNFDVKNFKKTYFPGRTASNKQKKQAACPGITSKKRGNYRNNETSYYSNYNNSNDIIKSSRREKISTSQNPKNQLNSPLSLKILINQTKKKLNNRSKKSKKISFNSNRNYNSEKIINLNFKKSAKVDKIVKKVKERKKSKVINSGKLSRIRSKLTSPSRNFFTSLQKDRKQLFNSPTKKFLKVQNSTGKKSRSQDIGDESRKMMRRISKMKRKSQNKCIKKNKSFMTFNPKTKRKSFKSDKKVTSLNISKIESQVNRLSSSKKYTNRNAQQKRIEQQSAKVICQFDLGKTKQIMKKAQEDRRGQRIEILEETIFQQNELIKRLLGYMKEDAQMKLKEEVKQLKEENRELKLKLMQKNTKDCKISKVR